MQKWRNPCQCIIYISIVNVKLYIWTGVILNLVSYFPIIIGLFVHLNKSVEISSVSSSFNVTQNHRVIAGGESRLWVNSTSLRERSGNRHWGKREENGAAFPSPSTNMEEESLPKRPSGLRYSIQTWTTALQWQRGGKVYPVADVVGHGTGQ